MSSFDLDVEDGFDVVRDERHLGECVVEVTSAICEWKEERELASGFDIVQIGRDL